MDCTGLRVVPLRPIVHSLSNMLVPWPSVMVAPCSLCMYHCLQLYTTRSHTLHMYTPQCRVLGARTIKTLKTVPEAVTHFQKFIRAVHHATIGDVDFGTYTADAPTESTDDSPGTDVPPSGTGAAADCASFTIAVPIDIYNHVTACHFITAHWFVRQSCGTNMQKRFKYDAIVDIKNNTSRRLGVVTGIIRATSVADIVSEVDRKHDGELSMFCQALHRSSTSPMHLQNSSCLVALVQPTSSLSD